MVTDIFVGSFFESRTIVQDVYKRQAPHSKVLGRVSNDFVRHFGIICVNGCRQVGQECTYISAIRQTDIVSVSYTHLDVYKRQMYVRARIPL